MSDQATLNAIGIYTNEQIAEAAEQDMLSGEEVLALVVISSLAQDGLISKRMLGQFLLMHRSIAEALNTALVAMDDESFIDLHRL